MGVMLVMVVVGVALRDDHATREADAGDQGGGDEA